jgi:uncharacterized protein
MTLKDQIDQDLKQALLSGDKNQAVILRGLKSAILNVEIEKGVREAGLSNEDVINVLSKEAKKRQESADLYQQGGDRQRAESELAEKALIEKYLPAQLSDQELSDLVDQAIQDMGEITPQSMGQVIGKVKILAQGRVEGGRIAAAVKARLS